MRGELAVSAGGPGGADTVRHDPGVDLEAGGMALGYEKLEWVDAAGDIQGLGDDAGVPVGSVTCAAGVLVGKHLDDDGVVIARRRIRDQAGDIGAALESRVEGVGPVPAKRRIGRGAGAAHQTKNNRSRCRNPRSWAQHSYWHLCSPDRIHTQHLERIQRWLWYRASCRWIHGLEAHTTTTLGHARRGPLHLS